MNNDILVSIITPLYNAEKYVVETINSVLEQTYFNWEMIVVDDGSTDNSHDVVTEYCKKDSRIKLYKRDRLPKGPSTSRNIGVSKSKGDYIIFLDADDLLFPHCLERRVKIMQENANMDFCVFQMNIISTDKELDGWMLTHFSDNYLYNFISYKFPWTVTCPMWKSEFFRKTLVGFNENLLCLEDPELHVRALIEENVQYKVYADSAYLDCSYRFFKNKINLQSTLVAFDEYLALIYKMVDKKDTLYRRAFRDLYDQIILFYSQYDNSELKKNTKRMKALNKSFLEKKIISKKLYLKTNLFLYYVKYSINELKIVNSFLLKVGYDHFYGYRI